MGYALSPLGTLSSLGGYAYYQIALCAEELSDVIIDGSKKLDLKFTPPPGSR